MLGEYASVSAQARKRNGTPPPPPRSGRHPAATKRLSAVVVDDDHDLRTIFREVLEHAGWTVRTYAQGSAAIRAILAAPPDVVLTDINLGGLSGRGLARALRADPTTENVLIVAMSGSVSPSRGMLRAFDAFLAKPVDVASLSDLLLSLIESASD